MFYLCFTPLIVLVIILYLMATFFAVFVPCEVYREIKKAQCDRSYYISAGLLLISMSHLIWLSFNMVILAHFLSRSTNIIIIAIIAIYISILMSIAIIIFAYMAITDLILNTYRK